MNSEDKLLNQTNREELIKLLDKSDDLVKLEDLFLFDLSPYYKDKDDDSFFSKQLEYIQDKNVLSHNSEISFTSEQKEIYNQIVEKERVLISAPTSFGKTMLVKEYIYNFQPNEVVFLVPTNSLGDELIEDFNLLFKNLGYTIFDTVRNDFTINEKSIFIGTQEKYYQVFKQFNSNIDLFVIDEAYKLSDPINTSREVILNRTFIDTLNNANKVVLLLPLVNEINGLENLNFKILKSDYAPVAKNFKALKEFNKDLLIAVKEERNSNLIYFDLPSDAESFFLNELNFSLNSANISNEWIKRVELDFHKEWIPIMAIKNGIGIHYGPMPKFVQKKMIELFNNSTISTLLATSSVIEGVNTPTKSIYITTPKKILGDKNRIKFKNLIGRAGRLGKHKVGNVFYQESDKDKFEQANQPYSEINLNFIIENEAQIIEINREEEFISANDLGNKPSSEESTNVKTKDYLNDSNYGNVPFEEISDLLNNFGYTIKQFKKLIDYSSRNNINLFGILGTLKSSDNNIYSINIINDSRYDTIEKMVNRLQVDRNFKRYDKSKLVSIVIKMIYNVIPHKVIPALEFIVELNDLYKSYNKKNFLSYEIIREANLKKVLFYNKFLGKENLDIEDSRKIMTKLFEYGIPYFRVKNHFNDIASRVPHNFSIYDIKKIIFENESMIDLRIYFE